ncbi:unnamed protein product [Mycena citricolor]|uniref:Uncharacterized protein n=1 Tax=Mycena citricolor TaxID=2018698 RepID=A0AAD2HRF6_9AGAR|nr:unnamed protein product [Mycena citricolor]
MAMTQRPPRNCDYEPLRASVLDVFEQLGAFDDDSGIVEWIFPEVRDEKASRPRRRVKLTEVFDDDDNDEMASAAASDPPRQSRTSRFLKGIRSRSKSGTRKDVKEKDKDKGKPSAPKHKSAKKSKSSPNLREEGSSVPLPEPIKLSASTASGERRARKISLFSRKEPSQTAELPSRPSISDEEWQQITMTGSVADYDDNPFLGHDGSGSPLPPLQAKRDGGLHGRISRIASTFRSSTLGPANTTLDTSVSAGATPRSSPRPSVTLSASPRPSADSAKRSLRRTSGTVVSEAGSALGVRVVQSPLRSRPRGDTADDDDEDAGSMTHSNASTSTLQAVPAPSSGSEEGEPAGMPPPLDKEEDFALETTSQIDHVRTHLSDITEGDGSEASQSQRNSRVSTEETVTAVDDDDRIKLEHR